MHSIAETEDVSVVVVLGDRLVDEPFADIQELHGDRLVADQLLNPLNILFICGNKLRAGARGREEDEHPLIPRPDHAHNRSPPERREFLTGLHDPVQVANAVLDEVAQVGLDETVDREALTGLLDEWDLELSDDLRAGAIATKEVLGLDSVGLAGDVVADGAKDGGGGSVA